MKTKFVYVGFLVFVSLLGLADEKANRKVSPQNTEAAKRAWEKVIAAKGGRERLMGVRTFAVLDEWHGKRRKHDPGGYGRTVFEFPSKYWHRGHGLYFRRDVPGFLMQKVANVDESIMWDFYNGENHYENVTKEKVQKFIKEMTCRVVPLYLPETRWYQPTVIALDEMRWYKKDVLVIYVISCFGPAAYVIDPATNLPLFYTILPRADFEKELPAIPERVGIGDWMFADYISVEGVMLPKKVSGLGDMTYEINREYPNSMFTKQPELNDWGPWPPPEKH